MLLDAETDALARQLLNRLAPPNTLYVTGRPFGRAAKLRAIDALRGLIGEEPRHTRPKEYSHEMAPPKRVYLVMRTRTEAEQWAREHQLPHTWRFVHRAEDMMGLSKQHVDIQVCPRAELRADWPAIKQQLQLIEARA